MIFLEEEVIPLKIIKIKKVLLTCSITCLDILEFSKL